MTLIKIVVAVLCGVILGLVFTIDALDPMRLGPVAGPWHGSSHDAIGETDPYALAATARAGLMPLGSTEGLSFIAETDSDDRRLTPDCDYAVAAPMPQARFWTLSLLTPEGFPVADAADRYAFTSAEVLRLTDQPVIINVSRTAQTGNWLPVGHALRFVLMLRLYDTALSTIGSTFAASAMPKIERVSCR